MLPLADQSDHGMDTCHVIKHIYITGHYTISCDKTFPTVMSNSRGLE